MAGRNPGPPLPMNFPPGKIPLLPRELPHGRNMGLMPHPALLEEMRERERESQFGMGPRSLPPHPAILEERFTIQLQEIQGLLIDNQKVASTHVALKQELESHYNELQRMSQYADSFHAEKDMQMRELLDKSAKLEMDLQAADAMKAEFMRVQADVKELTVARQDLMARVQAMNQDLARAAADLQQLPALKAEIELMRQEVDKAKAAIEYEKKVYADSYEQGQVMQKNLLSMTRELEKLRAEVANAEKRAQAAAAVANPATAGYNTTYSTSDSAYARNLYPGSYGGNPMQAGMENYPQYGPPGNWGAYNMQHGQGHR